MQAIVQTKSVSCNQDCFNCPYDDCIIPSESIEVSEIELLDEESKKRERNRKYQANYRQTHKEKISQLQHRWYEQNKGKRKECNQRQKQRIRQMQMNTCYHCLSSTGHKVIHYKKKYFCSYMCLADYMLNDAKNEIQEVEKELLV